MLMQTNSYLRKMETCKTGRPCYKRFSTWRRCEIALACHHRIMSDHQKSYMGLVECSVGVPGQEVRNGFENAPKKTIEYITQSKKN
jgi:3-hydroxyacyl-CoA dehydrogenase/enoyl-CoA hydratase/3-hydroxybutyryl-CoA epimerase